MKEIMNNPFKLEIYEKSFLFKTKMNETNRLEKIEIPSSKAKI